MRLYKEVFRHAGSTTIKETFFNSEKKVVAILDTYQEANPDSNSGSLSVYDYKGEGYRLLRYNQDANTYKRFRKEGAAVLLIPNWHTVSEANYIQECKYDKGLLLEEHTQYIGYGEKESVTYTYEKAAKTSEKRITTDGTKITVNYVNDNKGLPLSKSTLKNDIFTDQVNYTYHSNGKVSLEQTFHPYNGQKFLSAEKKFYYNTKSELEKTEYYGRYNGQLYLHKTEEEIKKENTISKKSAGISELDIAVGYYDMTALHQYFRENNMEAYIAYFDKDFAAKGRLALFNYTIETLDGHGSPVETQIMNPEKPEEQLTRATYRNEYNEASLPEFVITYILNDKKQLEENSIKKFYYKED